MDLGTYKRSGVAVPMPAPAPAEPAPVPADAAGEEAVA